MRIALRILAFGRPVQSRLLIALLAFLFFNLFNVFSLTLIIPFLEILFAQGAEPAHLPSSFSVESWKKYLFYQLYLFRQEKGAGDALIYFSLAIALAIVAKNAFRYLAAWHMARYENVLIQNLRNRVFIHLTRLPLGFFVRTRKGRLLNLATQDIQIIQEATIGTIYNLLNDPITMLFYLGTMLILSWKLTLISLIVLPITGWMISRLSRILRRKAHQGQQLMDRIVGILEEFLSGVRTVKAFGAEAQERRRFIQANESYTRFMIALRRRMELASPLTEVISVVVVLGLLYYGTFSVLQGQLKASEFITFIAIFGQFLTPMKTFNQAVSRMQKAIVSFRRIEGLLAQVPSGEYQPLRPISTIERGIRLERVAFRYGEKEVLRKISLHIPVGARIALVGPSGSGKTTLIDLLCGFYWPTEGAIYIDDTPLRELDLGQYRRLLGIVPQDGMLFHATLLENLTYGSETPVDYARLDWALEVAQAKSFIEELPEGLQTLVGERGQRFSGGQRQRIALARALYRQPQILILDEATSALDSESESRIYEALAQLPRTCTVIIIAHRLSTVRHADWIYVLSEGAIQEEGTHEELLERNGLYARLYHLQATP
ncbi:MAG: ABC transporter ATP-binding protein/permease [Bacteroidia bacterium]|nr:ABC transporter ATP-binding protein/permease [Bacteroidia bacterium]MDW8236346.1 ABC transporter ATP-binding protein [Bacteroidia bacterium]